MYLNSCSTGTVTADFQTTAGTLTGKVIADIGTADLTETVTLCSRKSAPTVTTDKVFRQHNNIGSQIFGQAALTGTVITDIWKAALTGTVIANIRTAASTGRADPEI